MSATLGLQKSSDLLWVHDRLVLVIIPWSPIGLGIIR